jgi:UTP--glucose-1-phosphate uridylyltransferase
LGHAVLCAKRHIGEEPFAVLLGDDVVAFGEPCLAQMIRQYERFGRSVVAVQRVKPAEVSAYGIIDGRAVDDRVHEVFDLVEKPSPQEAPSELAIIGRYILEPEVFEILEGVEPGVGGEIQLTDALRVLNRERSLIAYEFEGVRYDVGDKLGYLRAIVDFALARPDLSKDFKRFLVDRVSGVVRGTSPGSEAGLALDGLRLQQGKGVQRQSTMG